MIDRSDLRILEALQEHGDMGPVELSEKVALSASQCSRRLAALRRDGYIASVRAILDPQRVNINVEAYVLLTMKSHAPDAAKAFRVRVLKLDEVLSCQMLTGAADMILRVATKDLKTFNRLLTQDILGAPEVATAQSSIVLEDIKNVTSLPTSFVILKK